MDTIMWIARKSASAEIEEDMLALIQDTVRRAAAAHHKQRAAKHALTCHAPARLCMACVPAPLQHIPLQQHGSAQPAAQPRPRRHSATQAHTSAAAARQHLTATSAAQQHITGRCRHASTARLMAGALRSHLQSRQAGSTTRATRGSQAARSLC
jgi:hypothetical protein